MKLINNFIVNVQNKFLTTIVQIRCGRFGRLSPASVHSADDLFVLGV